MENNLVEINFKCLALYVDLNLFRACICRRKKWRQKFWNNVLIHLIDMYMIDYFQDYRSTIKIIVSMKLIVFISILPFHQSNQCIISTPKFDVLPIIFYQNKVEVFCVIMYVSILDDIQQTLMFQYLTYYIDYVKMKKT